MKKILILIIILLFQNCSFDKKSGIWNNTTVEIDKKDKNFKDFESAIAENKSYLNQTIIIYPNTQLFLASNIKRFYEDGKIERPLDVTLVPKNLSYKCGKDSYTLIKNHMVSLCLEDSIINLFSQTLNQIGMYYFDFLFRYQRKVSYFVFVESEFACFLFSLSQLFVRP